MALSSQDDEYVIRELIKTVHRLMAESSDGWVRWSLVAKELRGSAEYKSVCIGYAELAKGKQFFAGNESVVRQYEETPSVFDRGLATYWNPVEAYRKHKEALHEQNSLRWNGCPQGYLQPLRL